MLTLRISAPSDLTEQVLDIVGEDPAVSSLALMRGASLQPAGDIVLVDIAREAANEIVGRLEQLDVSRLGSIHIEPVSSWLSESGLAAEKHTPGSSADAVVWAEVTQRAYAESELNWTYLSFMTLATLLAGIAIILDTQILVIGAMVLGPEFVAIAALGLALVRRRRDLGFYAARTLVLGFGIAIGLTTLAALAGRVLGWIAVQDITGARPSTDFIYTPTKWSFIVALIAAAAGVLSLTSAKTGGLSGVFISVTTVPAAGNIALALAFGLPHEIWGSAAQLLLNISGMAVAGWATLAFQQVVWSRMSARRARGLRREQRN
ncbi:DUF389 domain-containing protein [Nocardioides sp.]|jgi:uncharacterized hydrophobic protein (TIGR00271 family)|uniref:DUF389 domain-containing protein n=1 Tax=Nocardioides sp. TaxID=35761 RepID=UPI002F4086A6